MQYLEHSYIGALTFELPDFANKMHQKCKCPKHCMGHTDTTKLFVIYLEFTFNWHLLVHKLAPYTQRARRDQKKLLDTPDR